MKKTSNRKMTAKPSKSKEAALPERRQADENAIRRQREQAAADRDTAKANRAQARADRQQAKADRAKARAKEQDAKAEQRYAHGQIQAQKGAMHGATIALWKRKDEPRSRK
jgi:hypothetical protein